MTVNGMSVEQNLSPDDGGIAGETFLPAGMTQDHDRMRLRRLIFFREKTAPERRLHSEDVEVIAGNIEAPDALVHAVVTEAGDDEAISEQTGEDRVAVAIILVVQIRLESEIGAVAQLSVDRDQVAMVRAPAAVEAERYRPD